MVISQQKLLENPHVLLDGAATLPKKWQNYFPCIELPVFCGEETHIVKWSPDKIETPFHSETEIVFSSLGGEVCECLDVAQTWRTGKFPSKVSAGEAVSHVPLPQVEQYFARFNKYEATQKIFSDVMFSWMNCFGADTSRNPDILVWKTSPDESVGDQELTLTSGFATWGAQMQSRAAIFTNSSWYDRCVHMPPVQNSRLFLGHNGKRNIFLEPVPSLEHEGIMVASPLSCKNREDVYTEPPVDIARAINFADLCSDSEYFDYVGKVTDRNTSVTGMHNTSFVLGPDTVLYGTKDALGWEMRENVWRTFVLDQYVEEKVGDSYKRLPEGFELGDDDVIKLSDLCAQQRIGLEHVSNRVAYIQRRLSNGSIKM